MIVGQGMSVCLSVFLIACPLDSHVDFTNVTILINSSRYTDHGRGYNGYNIEA